MPQIDLSKGADCPPVCAMAGGNTGAILPKHDPGLFSRTMDRSNLRDTPIVVFGVSGFLGRPLVRQLASCGARVHAVSRSVKGGEDTDGVVWHACDAADLDAVSSLFASINPRIVFNLTSDSQGGREIDLIPDSLRNDLLAAVNIMIAAHRHEIEHLITTGSMEEPAGDAATAVPSSPYAAAKWAGSAYARMMSALYDLPVTILRPTMTYGLGQKSYKLVPSVIEALLDEREIPLSSGNRLIDWVYLDDVTDAFIRAAIAPPAGATPIDIGSGRPVSIRDCLSVIAALTGGGRFLRFGALPDRPLEREFTADTETAARLLGWRARTSLETGLAKTIAFIRADRADLSVAKPRSDLLR